MKRFALTAVSSVLTLGILAGCGGVAPATEAPATGAPAEQQTVTLKVGATPVPHAEILNHIKAAAAAEGIDLQVMEFTDYVRPNIALAEGDLDANYFQHLPYLTSFSADRNLDLTNAGPIHLEPLGLYSVKADSLEAIADGAMITIPADATNAGRALNLLEQQGLITLKEGVGVAATPADVVENPKQLKIELLDAEQLPRTLQDATAAVINGNYYLEAKNNLNLDAVTLAQESPEGNPYANILAVRTGDESRPEIVKLLELLQSESVKQFLEQSYDGAVIPAF